ncbi:MAG: ABC transporter substrate binding protein, partial [Eubacteriales bacterium]|nr:ABC transporter substrate binding protein [Eubacteriales bacterium]
MKKQKLAKAAALTVAAAMMAAMTGCSGSTSATTTAAETAAETSEEAAAEDTSAAENEEAGAGAEASADDGTTYQIGVLQFVQHDALDKANEGFVEALDESGISYDIDQQNAAGETATCTTIAQK